MHLSHQIPVHFESYSTSFQDPISFNGGLGFWPQNGMISLKFVTSSSIPFVVQGSQREKERIPTCIHVRKIQLAFEVSIPFGVTTRVQLRQRSTCAKCRKL